ncbi:MAG TPA: sialidase family protein [Methanothrix sp.]|nr:sialidase family protein [Methanothrix sp.]HOL44353.1 sialidase family protein [Methanothrix sp.]
MPNEPRFVGTFDVNNFTEWWVSEPLPGDVADVVDYDWAYGTYYVAIVRMQTNAYEIYQSRDYGRTWRSVFRAPSVLYNILRVDPGWLLCSASDGWYESTNSGSTWTKVSSDAPGCRIIVNVGNDILLAHDGRKVWRSTNGGRNWSISLNPTWDSDSYPALDGFGRHAFAAVGGLLYVSDDTGGSWREVTEVFRGKYNLNINNYRVLQILLTRVDEINYNLYPRYMMRVYHKDLGIVRHYYIESPDYTSTIYAKFDQPFSGYENGQLTTHIIARTGTPRIESMVFSAQMRFNTQRNAYEPSLKYSLDGGITWNDMDISNFTVYSIDITREVTTQTTPPQTLDAWIEVYSAKNLSSYHIRTIDRNPYYITFNVEAVRHSSFCVNNVWWSYDVYAEWYKKEIMQSYDCDLYLKNLERRSRPFVIDTLIWRDSKNVIQYLDTMLRKSLQKTFVNRASIGITRSRSAYIDNYLQKAFNTEYDSDTMMVGTIDFKYSEMDVWLVKTLGFHVLHKFYARKTFMASWVQRSYLHHPFSVQFADDILLSKTFSKSYAERLYARKTFTSSRSIDSMLVKTVSSSQCPVDYLSKRELGKVLYSDFYALGTTSTSYGANVVIVENKFDKVVVEFERVIPQIFELWSKMIRYDVFDSRKDIEYNL